MGPQEGADGGERRDRLPGKRRERGGRGGGRGPSADREGGRQGRGPAGTAGTESPPVLGLGVGV